MSKIIVKDKKFIAKYRKEFLEKFEARNGYQAPLLEKIVVNVGAGEAVANPKCLSFIQKDLTLITGQKPVLTKAKKSIANFKSRIGVVIGVFVTLRGSRMYDFLNRLTHVAIPRIRDFKGLSVKAFDKGGNYTLGLKEQLVFNEIEFDKTDKVRGLSITFVTSAKNAEHAKFLLSYLGLPFRGE